MLSPEVHQAVLEIYALKLLPRAGWLRTDVRDVETVAAHSWGTAFLAYLLCPAGLKRERVLAMALLHDVAEVKTGDITPYDRVPGPVKAQREREAFAALTRDMPQAEELGCLQREYQQGFTPEARFVHRCDKLDMMFQAQFYQKKQPEVDVAEFIQSALQSIKSLA